MKWIINKLKKKKDLKTQENLYKVAKNLKIPTLTPPTQDLNLKNFISLESNKTKLDINKIEYIIKNIPHHNNTEIIEKLQSLINIDITKKTTEEIELLNQEIKTKYFEIHKHLENLTTIKNNFHFYQDKISQSIIDFKQTALLAEKNLEQNSFKISDFIKQPQKKLNPKLKYLWIYSTLLFIIINPILLTIIMFTK